MVSGVKNVILVLSGKGGVGKTTVSAQLAIALKNKGFKVGLLDVDICGPSIPYILGLENSAVHQCAEGWVPVYADSDQKLAVMSIGFLLQDRNSSVIWRGPKKTAMIKQFLNDVYWQEIDFLVIDTPPGTSDEHITVVENVRNMKCAAVIVTTPQSVAIEDVRKEITFCKNTGVPILGIVENMSGFVCPSCSECSNIFSKGGGELLSKHAGVPFLGSIPIDPRFSQVQDIAKDSPLGFALEKIVSVITAEQ